MIFVVQVPNNKIYGYEKRQSCCEKICWDTEDLKITIVCYATYINCMQRSHATHLNALKTPAMPALFSLFMTNTHCVTLHDVLHTHYIDYMQLPRTRVYM